MPSKFQEILGAVHPAIRAEFPGGNDLLDGHHSRVIGNDYVSAVQAHAFEVVRRKLIRTGLFSVEMATVFASEGFSEAQVDWHRKEDPETRKSVTLATFPTPQTPEPFSAAPQPTPDILTANQKPLPGAEIAL